MIIEGHDCLLDERVNMSAVSRREAALRPYIRPQSTRPRKRLTVTVCVGAIAGFGNAVVVAMDQMLTVGDTTSDLKGFAKGMRIHPLWFAAYAGDVAQVPQILTRATNLLGGIKRPRVEKVTNVFLKVYNDHRKRVLAQGATDFELDFLIAGFDVNGSPRLLTIEAPGVEKRWDNVGFWAVGIGADLAINNLMLRGHNRDQSLDESVYQVAESKFVSEVNHGIGTKTAMAVMGVDGSAAILIGDKTEKLREIWEREGRAPMPKNLGRRIAPMLEFVKAPVITIKQTRKRKALKR